MLRKKWTYIAASILFSLFSNIKQLKPKLSFPFTSNVVLLCGMHSLYKDPVFLSDYFLLMVEFCNRFGVGHRWQQPKGFPGDFGVQNPQSPTTLLWCGPVATIRIWQLSDTWLAAEPAASCLGPLWLAEEEMRGRRWLHHMGLVLVFTAHWIVRELNEKPPCLSNSPMLFSFLKPKAHHKEKKLEPEKES